MNLLFKRFVAPLLEEPVNSIYFLILYGEKFTKFSQQNSESSRITLNWLKEKCKRLAVNESSHKDLKIFSLIGRFFCEFFVEIFDIQPGKKTYPRRQRVTIKRGLAGSASIFLRSRLI